MPRDLLILKGVHIHSMRNGVLRVSLLQRGTFVKQPQKYPKRPCPGVRPSLRSGSLVPVLLRGHAATGHPWPIAALPASMPGHPLRRTSTRPPEGACRSRSKTRSQARSKDRETSSLLQGGVKPALIPSPARLARRSHRAAITLRRWPGV